MSAKRLIPEEVLSFVPEHSGNEQPDQDVENLAHPTGFEPVTSAFGGAKLEV